MFTLPSYLDPAVDCLKVERFVIWLLDFNWLWVQFGYTLGRGGLKNSGSSNTILTDTLEVGVFECLGCSESLGRVHSQHTFQQAQGFWCQFANISFLNGIQDCYLGELHPQKPLVFEEVFVVVRSQRSDALLNEKQLVDLVFPREHGHPIHQLPKNTAYRPNIHLLPILRPYQQLRGSIPPGSHIVSENLLRSAHLPGKPKITNLELILIPHQQILWFDIPMHNIHRVQVRYPLNNLIQ